MVVFVNWVVTTMLHGCFFYMGWLPITSLTSHPAHGREGGGGGGGGGAARFLTAVLLVIVCCSPRGAW